MDNINVLSLFSGIGAFEKALDRKGIGYNLVNYCEFDKYASKSYSAVHGVSEMLNLGDITKVNIAELEPHSADLITYGFPCQDISNAGKQRGFEHDGQLTRSGLFFYAAAIIGRIQPKVAICENVKALTGKKFTKEFETVLSTLEDMGYTNYWKVLNAKDYGIPQNRERVFIVSVRNDIDKKYTFPAPIKLELRLKDILEKEVDEKYYLSDKTINGFLKHNENHEEKGTGFKWKPRGIDGVASCLRANAALAPTDNTIEIKPERIGGIFDTEKSTHQARSIWDKEKISPTIDTAQGGYRQPLVFVPEATKKGYAEAQAYDSINLEQPNSKTRRGRVGKQQANTLTTSCNQAVVEPFIVASRGRNPENPSDRTAGSPKEQRLEVNMQGISNCLTSVQKDNLVVEAQVLVPKRTEYGKQIRKLYESGMIKESRHNMTELRPRQDGVSNTLTTVQKDNYVVDPELRIRKLTPLECWRLMGFDDEDFYKAEKVNSNTQLYKQAGNSIVVNVLEAMFDNLKGILYD